MVDVAKDLAAGTLAGSAQLLVGHPFDTIKVKLQSQPSLYFSAMDATKKTVAAEGTRGLFKGMGAPLATVAILNAILFTARGQMETLLRQNPQTPLSVTDQAIAGAGAGAAVSIAACPTELIKCRLQAQSAPRSSATVPVRYSGPLDVAAHVLRSEGGVRGLFRGLTPTLLREVPGNAAMFGAYEALKQAMAGGTDTSQLSRGQVLTAGGLAGGVFWLSVYPADVIKSVIQVDDGRNRRYKGSIDALFQVYRGGGVRGLYRGFSPAIARSVPANAACFLVYELSRSSLG